VETESHLLAIAEREEGRLKQEIQKLAKELEEMKERKNVFEVRLFVVVFCRGRLCRFSNPILFSILI